MTYSKKELALSTKETLIQVVEELQLKLKKKNTELNLTRAKLRLARASVMKMKDTVQFQRQRIIELHP